MAEVFLDAFLDTLKVLPFLLVIYIVIELIEHKTTLVGNRKILQGRLAPLLGSAAGVVPLCGFSVMAAKLYDKKYIGTGTLLAVFIATSDEAIIVLATDGSIKALAAILPLIIVKFIIAVAVGYAVNALLYKEQLVQTIPDNVAVYGCGHEHEHSKHGNLELYFLSPLWHSLKIALYLFIVNLAFGIIIFYAGEDNIAAALAVNEYVQPLITAAVGLIPSCASSVIITGAYIHGGIYFGSMLAGLIVNAGMGFVILFKNPKQLPRNLSLLLTAFAVAYLFGLATNLIQAHFPALFGF